eukprot:Tamp_11508.p1 GENE.Tamp_11508~~Tamp_11508.p1  ORF type:complete len:534 (+),score=136.96 Tamp_11508:23-1624(+)
MSRGVVRGSKYRHVFGKALAKESWYEGIQGAGINAPDSNIVACNAKYFALAWKGGGGPFVVQPYTCTGKLERVVDKEIQAVANFNGHSMPVQDLDFSPFHETVIATASEDSTVRVWNFEGKLDPQTPLAENQNEDCSSLLKGHAKKVTLVRWNPVASHMLLTGAFDNTVRVWDASSGTEAHSVTLDDSAQHLAWAYNGACFAVACKDKKLNLCDPRANGVSAKFDAHLGTKGARVCFLGKTNLLASTGFSRQSDRQLFLYDVRQTATPVHKSETTVDQASGSLMPFYDPDTSLLYIAGKGDCNIRYYEIVDNEPHIHYVDQFTGKEPQRGLALCPKGVVDTTNCEVARFLRLCDQKIEPLSFTVPRKAESGNEDLYPDTFAGKAALTAQEWLSGKNATPVLMPLSEAGKFNTFVLPTTESDSKPAAQPSPAPKEEPPKPKPAPATRAAPPEPSPAPAPTAPSGGGEPSTATVTLDLDGVGTGGVAVQGSVQLKVVIPCADDRIAALEARVKELEAENADLKKKNRELGNKLTD